MAKNNKPLISKRFKGLEFKAYRETPNTYRVEIPSSNITFYMLGENKIDKIARQVINKIRNYSNDGVISRGESVKIERFINDLLKKEEVNIKTLTPITKVSEVIAGCILIPRDVDIVANEDVLIVESVENGICNCIAFDNDKIKNDNISVQDVISGYLVVDYINDDVKYYINYKKQIQALDNYFIKTIKSISTDINETANSIDDHLEDFIKNSIISSKYNGLLKERMISFIEEEMKK